PPGALGGDVVAVEVQGDIPPGLFPDCGDACRDCPDCCVVGFGAAFKGVVVEVALRGTAVPGAVLDAGEDRCAPPLDHLVRRAAVVAVPVGDEPRHDVVEVLPVRAPVVEGDRLQAPGEAALLIDTARAQVLRLVPLDRVPGRWGGDTGTAAGSHRDCRGGFTFSREAHRALSARADLAVSRQPVRLLPRLDLRDGARADLPVHSRANDALHGGMVEQSLMLHLVERGDVTEVPVLAYPSPLIPAPPVQATIALEPVLDRCGMDINRAPILVIRAKIRRRNIHATRLARPNPASISTVRLELPTTSSRGIVLLKQRDLLSLRTASRPDAKVNTSISDRTIQRPRQ